MKSFAKVVVDWMDRLARPQTAGEKTVPRKPSVKRVHLWVSGRVQGVFFRQSTETLARELGLVGWVRNLPDGRVEAIAEGEAEALDRFLAFCHHGPPAAKVDHVELRWEAPPRKPS